MSFVRDRAMKLLTFYFVPADEVFHTDITKPARPVESACNCIIM